MKTWDHTSRRPGRSPRLLRSATGGLLAALFAFPGLVLAQELDAGQLQWRADGRRIGVERFRIWRTGSTFNAVATIERVQGEERKIGLQMDPDLVPMKYEFRETGSPSISGERYADRVQFHTVSREGERWREFPPRSVRAIVEPGVAHHYLVLLRILEDNPGGVAVVIPSRGERARARLTGERADRVDIGQGSVAATRYDVEIGDIQRSVWLDSDGRLLRVLDPATGREAVRLPARD